MKIRSLKKAIAAVVVLLSLHLLWINVSLHSHYINEGRRHYPQRLSSSSSCQETPVANRTVKFDHFPGRASYDDFLTGPGLDASSRNGPAVCEFLGHGFNSAHYPHAMEHLYRCWSWWKGHPNASRILIRPANHMGFPATNWREKGQNLLQGILDPQKSLYGMTQALVEVLNVTIMTTADPASLELQQQYAVRKKPHGMAFRMLTSQDGRDLTDIIRSYYDIPVTADCRRPVSEEEERMMPRIGILNRERRSKRSILNVEELAAYLQDELRAPVRVATFERSSFLEQVAFFSDTDIVISPHGAQLTGLPFMPQRCAAVLELFPAKYYNNYFWSLAVSAGIAHAGLYMSEQDLDKEMEHRYDGMSKQHRYKARGRWRSVHFCPNPRKMTDLIRPLIEEWKHCCRRRQQEE